MKSFNAISFLHTDRAKLPGSKKRGFTLIIAVTMTMVFVTIIASIVDVSFRRSKLVTSAVNSSTALYAADTGLECALFYDLRENIFFSNAGSSITGNTGINCGVDTDIQVTHVMPNECGGYSNITYDGCHRYEFEVQSPDGSENFLTTIDYVYRDASPTVPGEVIIISNGYDGSVANQEGVANRRLVYEYQFGGPQASID